MCCINQFVLSKDNQELINYLIKIYFVFFKVPVCRMCVCVKLYMCVACTNTVLFNLVYDYVSKCM